MWPWRRDVRCSGIKIPCGFRRDRVKKRRRIGRAHSRRNRPRGALSAHGRPSANQRSAAGAAARLCRSARSWSRPPRSSGSSSPRAGAIRRSTCSTCRPSSARRCLPASGPALFAALASALAYNFFFTAPHLTFRIDNPNDVVTVVVLFAVAVVTSQLAASVRRQARIAEAHARAQRDHRRSRAAAAGAARAKREIAGRQHVRELARGLRMQCRAGRRIARTAPAFQRAGADAADAGRSRRRRPGRSTAASAPAGDVDRAVPTEWQFHPVRSGSAVIAAMGLARDDGAPAVRSGPAAAARQSARPGGAGPGARPARERGARVRPRPRTRPGPLGCSRRSDRTCSRR